MLDFRFNDADDYEPSDSDDDYTEKEKSLLKKVRTRKQKYSDSEVSINYKLVIQITNVISGRSFGCWW